MLLLGKKWVTASGLRIAAATKLFSSKPSFARRNQTIKVENNMKCMHLFLFGRLHNAPAGTQDIQKAIFKVCVC